MPHFKEGGRPPFRLTARMTLDELREINARRPHDEIVMSTKTSWWGRVATCTVYRLKKSSAFCDPRGNPLIHGSLKEFLETLPASVAHYGRFGVLTLMAGYHGNLVDADGRPWCFAAWPEYERFVEIELARQRVLRATGGTFG